MYIFKMSEVIFLTARQKWWKMVEKGQDLELTDSAERMIAEFFSTKKYTQKEEGTLTDYFIKKIPKWCTRKRFLLWNLMINNYNFMFLI